MSDADRLDPVTLEAIERLRAHTEDALLHSGRVEEDELYETTLALITNWKAAEAKRLEVQAPQAKLEWTKSVAGSEWAFVPGTTFYAHAYASGGWNVGGASGREPTLEAAKARCEAVAAAMYGELRETVLTDADCLAISEVADGFHDALQSHGKRFVERLDRRGFTITRKVRQ